MVTQMQTMTSASPNAMPLDLRRWIDPGSLVRLTLEATTEINEASIDVPGFNNGSIDHRPRVLLAVLTYCYAAGTLSSEEIERHIRHDDMVRYLAANSYPGRDELRLFRRRWKQVIKQCLVNLLILVWRVRTGERINTEPPWRRLGQAASAPTVPAALLREFVCEADHRIYQAVQLDSMALDF
jgi:hypothetical protein